MLIFCGDDCTLNHSSITPAIYNTSLRLRHDMAKASFDQLKLRSKSTITALTDDLSKTSLMVALGLVSYTFGCENDI